ncbi:hypothetical protein FP2506_04461 [Fulvimarina pelagi HTCC2506]|uniref:Uncharacterized protein n=1 Tax=Fulvimarina pelagi HTCC2506 TaxID=314231 RepID=Q0FZZ0_9HYPH|nr:hypothetical protein FP2506_04461 [Fulvimarina pelagi HTCC2506]
MDLRSLIRSHICTAYLIVSARRATPQPLRWKDHSHPTLASLARLLCSYSLIARRYHGALETAFQQQAFNFALTDNCQTIKLKSGCPECEFVADRLTSLPHCFGRSFSEI